MVDGMVDGTLASSGADTEPISKEEALKRFLARKASMVPKRAGAAAGPEMTDTKAAALVSVISGMSDTHWSPTGGGSPNCKRKDEVQHRPDQRENDDQAKHGDYKKLKQEHRDIYPASKRSHFSLIPGHQNTTTKETMRRPPDMRLVTAMASKGTTLAKTLTAMNMGPSGRGTMLQTLTTRDVVMIPDLFEVSSGFVMPPDPWEKGDGISKTIYQRLVEEIHHAGNHEARVSGNQGPFQDKCFSTGGDGVFKEDENGLFKVHNRTPPCTIRAALLVKLTGRGVCIATPPGLA